MTFTSRLLLIVGAFVAFVCSFPAAQTLGRPERFTANAVSLSPQYGTGQQTIEITVDRWSLAFDRERLVTALQQKGPDELLKQLQKTKPVGRIRTPDSLGYDLRYTQQMPLPDGGRSIVIATDRPIGFWEATNRPRAFDYPFTVIQMSIGRDGMGSGTLSYATKIIAKDNMIELEDFATKPIMLNNIRAEPKKK